jgi:uncharacterized protein YegL
MKHNIFKYVAIAAALLASAVNAGAQYNITNGVGTSKSVTGPNTDGYYTIRLETFATGTTTVTETATPVDVVLVLDVSGSMDERGKMTKLKNAVNTFIETIQENDLYIVERDAQGNVTKKTRRVDEDNNPISLGNQISIVKFAEPTYYSDATGWVLGSETTPTTDPGNHFPAYTSSGGQYYYRDFNTNYNAQARWNNRTYTRYNATEVLLGFTATESDNNVTLLQNTVTSMIAAGSTAADYGLNLARLLLTGSGANPAANKVVIFFTDGSPTHASNFDNNVATTAIRNAKAIKASGATVFSIGVFDSTPTTNGNVWRYMNYVSSNYPTADGINDAGTGGDSTKKFYQDASSSSADLTAIFKSIAEGIGGAEATVGTSTQVRDVVTNSFVLPNDVAAADVQVFTSTATGSADGADDTDPESWTTPVPLTSVTTNIVNVDANGEPTSDPDKVKNKALIVQGFDYSKADSAEGAGDGNWVGPRYKNGNWTWAGKKVIIEFKVKADGQATGGESQTNTGNSGVWVQGDDGTYTCVNHYAEPHTTLTVNIKIRKTGLRIGESATFELMRIRPKGYNPDGATNADKVANLEYNLIGKPKPGTHEPDDPTLSPDDPDPSAYYETIGWESFKKVILTNLSDTNGAEVIKDVLALDPYWVYMVVEDDWGWSYEMSGDNNQVGEDGTYTTSTVEVNPFRFHNTEKTNVVKHAEAVMVNHFQSVEEGASSYTEHKKSSKTKFD